MISDVENCRRTVNKIVSKLGDLPSAPDILNKAIKLTSDLDSNITDVSRSIAADQSISGKVIRMSNSPIFARMKRVSSLDEAIKVLGFNQLKSIIITASTFQMFGNCTHADVALKLWHHSFSTAIAARLIADRLTALNKDEAYLAGLMHDVGKLILLKTAPIVYTGLIEVVVNTQSGFVPEEQKELGFDHTDVGVALLDQWNFPQHILTAVADHHRCNLAVTAAAEQLARVIALANSVSRYIGTDFYEPYKTRINEEYYLGPDAIEGDRLIMIQCDTESEFNSELSLLND
ncbi:MAG: HDOD domain-containing protein [candidate division Zixibacteria bacterium]|nr:HDOD domain-containing protein [candidate division Zixibacteria bacterium]